MTGIRKVFPAVASLSFAVLGAAQGRTDYLNFESPQVEPIALARVGSGNDPYLLVCNTPDNRVEVYDVSTPDTPVLEQRILVGLEPVSVAYKSFSNGRQMMYTANWLGDSVTYVELFSTANVLTSKLIGTFPINHTSAFSTSASLDTAQLHADEPVHVVATDGGTSTSRFLLVAKRFGSSFSWLDAFTGAPVDIDPDGAAGPRAPVLGGGTDVIMTNNGIFPRNPDGTFPPDGIPGGTLAVKEPQCIAIPPGSTGGFWVLGQQGGGSQFIFPASDGQSLPAFNLDLWTWDAGNPGTAPAILPTTPSAANHLGTTNFNAAFDSAGALYVVGTEAQNSIIGNSVLSTQPTGFVKTMLYRINVNPTNPTASTVDPLELNSPGVPFVAHATDIDIYEPTSGPNSGSKFVIVAGFNSDRVARVLVDTPAPGLLPPSSWVIVSGPAPRLAPSPEMAGPRGVAVDSSTQRGYFLNAVDNSIFVANLESVTMPTPTALQNDPLPTYIRRGKKFLYSNVTSFGGMSCASCHVDARSDQLLWRLSTEDTAPFDTTAAGDPLGPQNGFEFNIQFDPANFPNGGIPYLPYAVGTFIEYLEQGILLKDGTGAFDPAGGFPHTGGIITNPPNLNAKGPMITQSLQGLSNFEVLADGNLRHYFSNAPYHWRGDKKTFLDFEEAFVSLQGQSGLQPGQMAEYEEFINSVHYPPNAIEPISRRYSGSLGTPNSLTDGSGGRRGFKLFHIESDVNNGGQNLFGGRTCIACHMLPSGTDNRWTTAERHPGDPTPDDPNTHPLNSAALRGLRQKEGRLEISSVTPPPGINDPNFLQTGDFGTGHDGLRGFSINGFVGSTPLDATSRNDVTQFIREFDAGVAPIVGRTVTAYRADITNAGNFKAAAAWKNALITLMEDQARVANCGLTAHFFNDDGTADGNPNDVELSRGLWFKVTQVIPHVLPVVAYKEENTSTVLDRNTLLLLMATGQQDCVVFTATPLGSERRIASLSGDATIPSGSGTSIQLAGTVPNTANADGNDMTTNGTLTWNGEGPPFPGFQFPTQIQARQTLRDACRQLGLITILADEFDFPRRLKLTGSGLQEGGSIRLGIDMDPSDPPSLDASQTADFQYITLPIHPTDSIVDTQRIWQTTVEFDTVTLYMLLLGGPKGPGINDALIGNNPPPTAFNPTVWNNYRLSYTSPSGVTTAEVLVPLVY